jgi:hypothetical protein
MPEVECGPAIHNGNNGADMFRADLVRHDSHRATRDSRVAQFLRRYCHTLASAIPNFANIRIWGREILCKVFAEYSCTE